MHGTQQITSGKKDAGKSRLDLIPPDALYAVGHVFAFGAKKYGARDWECSAFQNQLRIGSVIAAALRHLLAHAAGELEDKESGLLHIDHAASCCLMLSAMQHRNEGDDDRIFVSIDTHAATKYKEEIYEAAI